MTGSAWDQRIERAEELAKTYPSASEILTFYKHIARFQKDLYAHLESARGRLLELPQILERFPPLLSLVEQVGPPLLARAAGESAGDDRRRWEELLNSYWSDGETMRDAAPADLFFARAFLQPYAEYLAELTDTAPPRYGDPICPFCKPSGRRKPQVGVLREEGHGAKRSLVCSLCSKEWDYRRIVCPACGESRFDRLPVYTAGEFEHVRVEACDTCKTYLKTVDLTKNGLAVPVVDELATTPLDLWAQEKGYTKLQPNLLSL